MLRTPLTRALSLGSPTRAVSLVNVRAASSAPPANVPQKIEVFVDDKSVMVDPGTTVLQVKRNQFYFQMQNCPLTF